MIEQLKARFNSAKDSKERISLTKAEIVLKNIGLKVSRKQLAALIHSGIIQADTDIGVTPKGNRTHLSFNSFVTVVAYLLTEGISGLHSHCKNTKFDILKYAQDTSLEVSATSDSIPLLKLRTCAAVPHLIDNKLNGQVRLEATKKLNPMVFRAIIAYQVVSALVDDNYVTVENLWKTARPLLFTKGIVQNFMASALDSEPGSHKTNYLGDVLKNLSPENMAKLLLRIEVAVTFAGFTPLLSDLDDYLQSINTGIHCHSYRDLLNILIALK